MSFFGSIWRMISSVFGVAEGKTEAAADRLVSGNPDNIKAQFRKTKGDWTRDYTSMREAVADLLRIREMRMEEVKRLNKESDELEQKMAGAIELYKRNNDERYRDAYGQLAAKNEEAENRIKELVAEIDEQQKAIDRYKSRLMDLQRQIEDLGKEEAETVADIVSSQKIRELNDRLSGLSTDLQSKNLEAIRTARAKAKAVSKLSSELTQSDKTDFDKELKSAGAGSKFIDTFDVAVGKKSVSATQDPMASLSGNSSVGSAPLKDPVQAEIDKLLSKT